MLERRTLLTELPTVYVATGFTNAWENGPEGTVEISRSGGDLWEDLTIYFTLSGSATEGEDYESVGGSILLPAGASANNLVIDGIPDSKIEGDESVTVTLEPSPEYTIGSPSSQSSLVLDMPVITVEATDPDAAETAYGEPVDRGAFTVSRSSLHGTISLNYRIRGSAESGADFEGFTGTYQWNGGGESTHDLTVTPVDDFESEEDETVEIDILPGSNYAVGDPATDTVTILDNDGETIQVDPAENDNSDPPCDCECSCQPPLSVDPSGGGIGFNPSTPLGGSGPWLPGYQSSASSSSASPHPRVPVSIQLPDGQTPPDSLEFALTYDGTAVAPVTAAVDPGWGGQRATIALPVDALTPSTGRYTYTVQVTAHRAGQTPETFTLSGEDVVVDRGASEFGDGWWIEGLDRLDVAAGGATLLRGDNSGGWFQDNGDGTYATPQGSFTDLVQDADGTYTLDTHHGAQHFSAAGLLVETRDDNGNATTFTYGASGELTQITDPAGRTMVYTYSGGRISTIQDFEGKVYTYAFEAGTNRIQSITAPDPDGVDGLAGPQVSLQYDAAGLLTSYTDPGQKTTTISREPDGRIKITRPDATAEYHTSLDQQRGVNQLKLWDAVQAVQDDGTGRISQVQTDPYGNVSRVEIDGQATLHERDENGLVVKMTTPDPDGTAPLTESVTRYDYDHHGRMIFRQRPDGATELWTYYADHAIHGPKTYTDAEGRSWTWTYDAATGRVLTEEDPLGNVTTYAYRPDGTYTVDGLLASVTLPDPDGTAGPLTQLTTGYEYDALGRLWRVTLPDGLTTNVTTYDGNTDRIATFQDGEGRITSYEYDGLGRLIEETLPDPDGTIGALPAPVIAYAYFASGRIKSVTRSGRTTDYQYDDRGRLETLLLPDPDPNDVEPRPTVTYEHDAAGRLLWERDPLVRQTTYGYDAAGRLETVTFPDPDGTGPQQAVVTYGYDHAGRLSWETDERGHRTDYAYADDRLVSVTRPSPDGLQPRPVVGYTYLADGQIDTVTNERGWTTDYDYDGAGRLSQVTSPDPDGAGTGVVPLVTQYLYDALGRLWKEIRPDLPDLDGAGSLQEAVTEYAYDVLGRLKSVEDALGGLTQYAYDRVGNRTSLTDPLGNTTTWTYDALDRIISETNDLGHARTFTYDAAGRLASREERNGQMTEFGYDDLDRLIEERWYADATLATLLKTVTYAYDAAGQLRSTTDAEGRTTSYTYDPLGRTTRVTQPDPDGAGSQEAPFTDYAYDAAGNLRSETDPLLHITSYAYDNLNRLIRTTDARGGETEYTYDAVGNLKTLTDPVSNTTTWTYDALDRVTAETNALSATRTYVYDAAGQLVQQTDRNGRVTEFSYDNLGRRIEERWLDGATVLNTIASTYDAVGQLLTAGDADSAYGYTYDALGRVASVTDTVKNLAGVSPFDVVLTSGYDAADRRTSLAATVGGTADFRNSYTYDALARMTRIEQSAQTGGAAVAQKRVDLAYNAAGQFTGLTRYADLAGTLLVASTTYSYDPAGRLTSLTHAQGATTLADYDWTFDPAGRVTQFISLLDGTTDYAYDQTDQLTGADHTGQKDEQYAYDANGNRTGSGYETGTGNQLLSDWSHDYQYDAEGNRTRKREIPILVAGADAGGGPHVRVYDAQTGAMRGEFNAYDAAFTGGVRVAVGDVNGDGFHDIVTAQGPNTDPAQPTEIRIFHGADGTLLGSFAALGAWSGGAFVAVGDVNGDGNADIIAAADIGGGPHVRAYSGADLTGQTMLWEFFAYDSTFSGGVRVAVGDVSGDGLADLITTQGPNTTDPTEIRVFRGTDAALLASFDALGAWTGGAFVAAGDVNADGKADIFVGADAGGGPHVRVYSGADLTGQTMLRDFHAYDPTFSGGVRVAAADADRDGRADLVTVQGPTTTGTPSEVRVFRGTDGALLDSFDALGAWTGGAFVGGNGQEALEDVSYGWDHRNRLIEVTYHAADGSPSKVVAYNYDVFNQRIAKHVDDNGDGLFDRSERYVYDGGNIVLAFDAGGSLTHRYLHGDAIDRVFADENALAEILWALSDNQGTVRDWAEYDAATATTTVANHVEFNSFGRIVSQSDPTAVVFYAYTGQEWDADAQLYQYARRWYDPETARFVSEDPSGLEPDTNPYRYVGNSPANFTDPSGLQKAVYGPDYIEHPSPIPGGTPRRVYYCVPRYRNGKIIGGMGGDIGGIKGPLFAPGDIGPIPAAIPFPEGPPDNIRPLPGSPEVGGRFRPVGPYEWVDEHGWRWHWDNGRGREKPHWDVQKPGHDKRIFGPNGKERDPDWRFIDDEKPDGHRFQVPDPRIIYGTCITAATVILIFSPIPGDELIPPLILAF